MMKCCRVQSECRALARENTCSDVAAKACCGIWKVPVPLSTKAAAKVGTITELTNLKIPNAGVNYLIVLPKQPQLVAHVIHSTHSFSFNDCYLTWIK